MDRVSIYLSLDRWITKTDECNIELLHQRLSKVNDLNPSIIVVVVDARSTKIPDLLNHLSPSTKFNFISLHDNHRDNPSLLELFGVFDFTDRSNSDYQVVIPRGIKMTDEIVDEMLSSLQVLQNPKTTQLYFRIFNQGTSDIILMKNPNAPMVNYEDHSIIPTKSIGADYTFLLHRFGF